jgi:hypothetical protein
MACLKKGMDIDTIAELTGLPLEKIELLKSAVQLESPTNQSYVKSNWHLFF